MKPHLIEQSKAIRNTLINNVDTIGKLIDLIKNLSQLAGEISSNQERKKMEGAIADLQDSLIVLIEQTTDLFKLYNKFEEDLFNNNG